MDENKEYPEAAFSIGGFSSDPEIKKQELETMKAELMEELEKLRAEKHKTEKEEYSRALNLSKDVTFLEPPSQKITCEEKLCVGDVILIKNYKYQIKVEYINYVLPMGGMVDYAGSYVELKADDLVLFNQKDIACIVKRGNRIQE